MELFNLLSDVSISVYGGTFDVSLNWIGNLIKILITAVGSVGVGIILFSVILKVIVLPFDIYQRISMRKQNIKMKENQAKMEKLQKQYANDKAKYNEKLMEMYKENGISMFSSCLPMILSLVIFIVAINAFNAYAQYSNIENYNTMVRAYKGSYEAYCADLKEENVKIENGKIIVKDKSVNKYIYYTLPAPTDTALETFEEQKTYIENASYTSKSYYVETEKAMKDDDVLKFFNVYKPANNPEATDEEVLSAFFEDAAQTAVLEVYNKKVKNNSSFLWIKNIWVTDASYKHPVLPYTEFEAEVSRENFEVNGKEVSLSDISSYTNVYGSEQYNKITGKLTQAKSTANGYFVLILLSIGTILLQQFVSMRSQKEQQQFSSVDGQGASQQKMMMIIMTGMFAIFSFMYSSAFSIYMITSNVLSLLSLLIINKLVDNSMEKKEEKAFKEKWARRFARTPNADDKNKKKK